MVEAVGFWGELGRVKVGSAHLGGEFGRVKMSVELFGRLFQALFQNFMKSRAIKRGA